MILPVFARETFQKFLKTNKTNDESTHENRHLEH